MAESSSRSSASARRNRSEAPAAPDGRAALIRGVQTLLGSFVGSLAGLTALCYGAGYFLYHAHLNMLGLGEDIEFPQEKMLVEGGRFFLYCVSKLLTDGLIIGGLIAFIIALWTIIKEVIPISNRTSPGNSGIRHVRQWFSDKHPNLADALILLVLVTLLGLHINHFFYPIASLQHISSILYDAPARAVRGCDMPAAAGAQFPAFVANMVKSGACGGELMSKFDAILAQYLMLVFLTAFTFFHTEGRGGLLARRLPRILVAAYAAIFTLILPIAFGVLVREPVYPTAEVSLAHGGTLNAFLLERTDTRILLWEDDKRRAVWYPSAQVESVQVTGERNIFKTATK